VLIHKRLKPVLPAGLRLTRERSLAAVIGVLAIVVLGSAATLGLTSCGGQPVTSSNGGQPATSSRGSQVGTTKICQEDVYRVPASSGTYIVQNNEFNSSAPECVTTDGSAEFTVANSSIDGAVNGAPGGYASIYEGCHWGKCSSGGLADTPIKVSNLTPGKVTTSWNTIQPGGGNIYDATYDIWFNRTPTTSGQPNCTELMIWLNHAGGVEPIGSQIAGKVSIGGLSYSIWEGPQPWGDTITYEMTTGITSVSGLDVGTLAQDAVRRGYLPRSCYLIDVEAGFELWRGGAGLATTSFSVNISGTPGAR
jgi:Glycosyl hydrolase family 12